MSVHIPRMSLHRIFALTLLAAVAAGSSANAETAVATKWRLTGEAQNDCLGHAEQAIFRLGFDKSGGGSQTMSGKKGDYTASIRCVSEQRIVFFVVSGPSAATTSRYLDAMYQVF